RVARFLLQEFAGRAWKPFERTGWMPGTILSSAVVVLAWSYIIWTGSIQTIWPMFGTANQLLAGVALAVATSAIINAGKVRYVWVTFVPMVFVSITTLTACYLNITDNFWPLTKNLNTASQGYLNILFTVIIMVCAVIILFEAVRRWHRVLVKGQYTVAGTGDSKYAPPDYGCC
ncbi:MAG TPA: carbon starvation CstA 5TM domain-containing protein, partial [Acidobacteriota bacterium]|nr:carbon starvation CstA 5TM domain-containing protein [Acidobacteriota bacterium]